ncbi:putative F-box protein At5g52610 [Hevea brasiliensis]|uniref:putative F-box protein At5g52610 n=1 Tax=Hevea brasiliensis TaxID=3981 RepID=UPI0025D67B77|nr:putative F-box protein At5g52610 [Hevea brasiliensis]
MESRDFNLDIIFEILSRSSLKTLAKCGLLSKEVNSLTYQSAFMNLHCQRTKTISGYFVQSLSYNKFSSTFVDNICSDYKLSLDFLRVPVKIEASTSQGILLCRCNRGTIPRYYVCKPSTKEWQIIPNPKTRYFNELFAMIVLKSNPLHYRILQEVKLSFGEFLHSEPTVSVCGSVHWLTTKDNILAFHEDIENYSMFSLPSPIYESDSYGYKKLTEYEGKLALICKGRDNSFMDLWVMESYGKKEWNKRQRINIESLREKEKFTNPYDFYNVDVVMMRGFYNVIFFKFKNGNSADIVRLHENFNLMDTEVFPFKSDFEPSNLKKGKKKKIKENGLGVS